MANSKTFNVISTTFCEYLSADVSGKNHHMGIIPLEAHLGPHPSYVPPLFLSVTIEPLVQNLVFVIEFVDPKGRLIVRAKFDCETQDQLRHHQVMTSNVQIPPIPFEGDGEYRVNILDGRNEIIYTRPFFMRTGTAAPAIFTAKSEVNLGPAFADLFA